MNYFQPDGTGFYLAGHSWTILQTQINNKAASRVGNTLYRETAAADYARPFFPAIAGNKELEQQDLRLFRKHLIQAAERDGVLKPKSWRLEGTFSKTGIRPQTVNSKWEDAIKGLTDARSRDAGLSGANSVDLISLERAKDVLSVEDKLVKNKWTVSQVTEHAVSTNFDPNLPLITLHDAMTEYLTWADVQTRTPISQNNPAPIMSSATLQTHRRFLGMVDRFFGKEVLLKVLKDKFIIQGFCQGIEPIPEPENASEFQAKTSGKTKFGSTKRPWKIPSQSQCASAIAALLKWASTPGIAHPGGELIYLSPLVEGDLWFPEPLDRAASIRDAKTATPHEYRKWLDVSFPTKFAARVALETLAGLESAEIRAKDSFINWEECYFHVGRSCKTGHRKVPLMDNLMVILLTLKLEGRLRITWGEKDDIASWTFLHAKCGYMCCDSNIVNHYGPPKKFRELYPLGFHKVTSKETGKDELKPWGLWTTKIPRHTFGSVAFEASNQNASVAAGLLGHKESQFLEAYAGKVHSEIWHGSIYRACKSFCQCLPKQIRARGVMEKEMGLPSWFLIQPDDQKAANRARIVSMVSQSIQRADDATLRQVAAVAENKTFCKTLKELSVKLGVAHDSVISWVRRDGFPPATASGYLLEDVKQWAEDHGLPARKGTGLLSTTAILNGRLVYHILYDLARDLGISVNSIHAWSRLPGFPPKSKAGWDFEAVKQWVLENKKEFSKMREEVKAETAPPSPKEPEPK